MESGTVHKWQLGSPEHPGYPHVDRLLAGFIVAFLSISPATLAQVEPIPLATSVTAQPDTLSFPRGRPQSVEIEIQLSDAQSGKPVARPGELYFTSTYNGIVYPEGAALDERGYARATLTIRPPSEAEYEQSGGRIVVMIIIEEEDADDTIEGRIVLELPAGER